MLYQILLNQGGKIRGALHSFSGSKEMMMNLIELGFYIAFSGSVTRKTAGKYHKNAQAAPLERILLETDAPSIATETTVAAEVEPRHIVEVAQKVAEIRGISLRRSAKGPQKMHDDSSLSPEAVNEIPEQRREKADTAACPASLQLRETQ